MSSWLLVRLLGAEGGVERESVGVRREGRGEWMGDMARLLMLLHQLREA